MDLQHDRYVFFFIPEVIVLSLLFMVGKEKDCDFEAIE